MQLSIIVVNWNAREFLVRCIASIRADELGRHLEVWVVDNNSSDGSTELMRSRFSDINLIQSSANLGFARANNTAIRCSSGEYILLLNPDTALEVGALERMLRFLEENPSAGAVGPILLGSDGAMQCSASAAPSLLRELSRMFHLDGVLPSAAYDMDSWDMDRPHEVDVLQGACLMIRRAALDEVGLLDEDYFMYSEEIDLCYRFRKAEWSIQWLPNAKVVHHGGQSSKQVPLESFLNLYKGKITYFRKHHGMAAAFAYKLILTAASVARLIASPLALLQQGEQRERHLALAGRYRRLLAEMPSL